MKLKTEINESIFKWKLNWINEELKEHYNACNEYLQNNLMICDMMVVLEGGIDGILVNWNYGWYEMGRWAFVFGFNGDINNWWHTIMYRKL